MKTPQHLPAGSARPAPHCARSGMIFSRILIAAGIVIVASCALVVLVRRHTTRQPARHATVQPAQAQASPPRSAPARYTAPTQAVAITSTDLTAQLAAAMHAYADAITISTTRFERLTGEQAVGLLAAVPALPGRIELASRVSGTCRNYAAGAWLLSNIFDHALAAGSVTDVFRAGWYWGNFALSHEQYQEALSLYQRTLAHTGAPPGIPYGSYSLLLERLATAQFLAGKYEACRATAATLYAFLCDDNTSLTADARASAAFSCLASLLNSRAISAATRTAQDIASRHSSWLEDGSLASLIDDILDGSPPSDPILILPTSLK